MANSDISPSPSLCTDQIESLSLEEKDDETRIKACLSDAEELKSEGNDYFRAKKWDEALVAYRTGLGRLPKRMPEEKRVSQEILDEASGVSGEPPDHHESEDAPVGVSDEEISEIRLEGECAKARSILNANIGACYVKLGNHKEAVDACTQALFDDPCYVKALQRRAGSNENINTWSSLTSAQEDYTKLLNLLPASSAQIREIEGSLRRLKPRIEAAQKEETAEMLGKLKGLGNSILGNFGLSTDNFKFEPNGQGGYSMNFSR